KEEDALKFLKVLPLRLAKFGLELNLGKTKLVKIGKVEAYQKELLGKRMPTFDFLGFTHYWGKSNTGKLRLKRKTSKKRFRRALVSLNQWLKEQRNRLTLQQLWKIISSKIRGHYNYFGVTDNIHTLQRFEYEAKRLIFARINRRSQCKSFTWKEFNGYLKIFPLPKPKISVNLGW
ncbi:MAG: group II intron reverse transcriptase/maturase, partial [Cyanobacteriota bacterium]